MTNTSDEQLSALADEELSESEVQFLVRRAGRTDEMREQLGRYAIMREALHRNLPDYVDPALARRIADAIDREPAHDGVPASPQRRWLRPVAGVAVAASVALVAIGLWPEPSRSPETPLGDIARAPAAQSVTGQPVRSENIQWDRLHPDVQERLQEYAVTQGQRGEPQLQLLSRPVGVSNRRGDE